MCLFIIWSFINVIVFIEHLYLIFGPENDPTSYNHHWNVCLSVIKTIHPSPIHRVTKKFPVRFSQLSQILLYIQKAFKSALSEDFETVLTFDIWPQVEAEIIEVMDTRGHIQFSDFQVILSNFSELQQKQDCLLQGQAQLDQRVIFRCCTLRLRSKKEYS